MQDRRRVRGCVYRVRGPFFEKTGSKWKFQSRVRGSSGRVRGILTGHFGSNSKKPCRVRGAQSRVRGVLQHQLGRNSDFFFRVRGSLGRVRGFCAEEVGRNSDFPCRVRVSWSRVRGPLHSSKKNSGVLKPQFTTKPHFSISQPQNPLSLSHTPSPPITNSTQNSSNLTQIHNLIIQNSLPTHNLTSKIPKSNQISQNFAHLKP